MKNRILVAALRCITFASLLMLSSCIQLGLQQPDFLEPPDFAVGDIVTFWDYSRDIPIRYVGIPREGNGILQVEVLRNGHEGASRLVVIEDQILYPLDPSTRERMAEIPSPYYVAASDLYSISTLAQLEEVLEDFEQLYTYERGVYDCSNMSVFLERYLENQGFDAWIRSGLPPWGPSEGRHAWVMVYTIDGLVVPVEATHHNFSPARVPGIIYDDNSYFAGYIEGFPEEGDYYDYDSIYSYACPRKTSAYAWWMD